MGCHQKALDRIDRRLREVIARGAATTEIDHFLDQRWDYVHRATNWDAERWGFDPDRWCEAERVQLSGKP